MIYRYLKWKFFIKRSTEELALYTTAFNTNFSRINKAICCTHEYYTYISEIPNKHIQILSGISLSIFAALWHDLWGTPACRSNYVDIMIQTIIKIYKIQVYIQSDANWSCLTFRHAIITLSATSKKFLYC